MELLAILTGSFFIGFSGAMMPGPLLTVAVADSAKRGFISGPLLMVGHAILEISLVAAILAGAGAYLQIPIIKVVISILGAGTLLWMGASMLKTAPGLSLVLESEDGGGAVKYPVVSGIVASVSNPYWIIWWATIGLGYLVAAQKAGAIGVAAFFIGHIASDFTWYSLVTFAVSSGRKLMNDSIYRNVIRFCAVFLLFFGAWFAYGAAVFFGEI